MKGYKGEVVEPFKVVRYKVESPGKMDAQTAVGVWLGKSLASDEHLIGTQQGIRRCRSCFRRAEAKRWEAAILESFRGVPWQRRRQHGRCGKHHEPGCGWHRAPRRG